MPPQVIWALTASRGRAGARAVGRRTAWQLGAFRLRVSGPPQEPPPEEHTGHTGLQEDTGLAGHSAAEHTGAPDDTDKDAPKEPEGCGCTIGPILGLAPALLALLVLRRRR